MKKITLILLVFTLGFAPGKKKIIEAFDSLNKYDYFKAKSLFEKCLKNYEVAASYGLSKIFYEEKNHFFNLDSSYKYIQRARRVIVNYDDKKLRKLGELGITDTSLNVQYHALSHKAFQYASDTNNIKAYNKIISKYPDTQECAYSIFKRDSIAFAIATEENSALAYKQFIEQYPLAKQRFRAMELYEQRKFDQISKLGSEADLVLFIQNNPFSPYLRKAQDELYELYAAKDEVKSYISFIQKYPDNPHVNLAYRNVFHLDLYDFSEYGIDKFESRFPHHPIQHEVDVLRSLIKNGVIQFQINDTSYVLSGTGDLMFMKRGNIGEFNEGLFSYIHKDKTGFYDHHGNIAIDPIYTDAFTFKNGLAVVENEGRFGVIDRRGTPIIPLKYKDMGEFSEGLIQAFDGNQYLFFNNKGQVVLKSKLEPIGGFQNGFLVIKQKEHYGIINKSGAFVIYPEFDWIENFNDSVARFKSDGYYGLIDSKGNRILESQFDFISKPSNGLRMVEKNQGVQYVVGTKISDVTFDIHDRRSAAFKDGFAVVKQQGKFGIIDTLYQKVLPIGYPLIFNLGHGLFSIKDKNKVKLFDAVSGKTHKVLYDRMELISSTHLIAEKEDKNALIARDEKMLIPYFEGTLKSADSHIIQTMGDKKALFDMEGNEVLSLKYDHIQIIKENLFLLKFGNIIQVYNALENKIIFEHSQSG